MAGPNPDCPSFTTWPGIAAHRQRPIATPTRRNRGLIFYLPPELARIALGPSVDLPLGHAHPPSNPAGRPLGPRSEGPSGGGVVRDSSPLAVVSKGITLRGLRKLKARLQAAFGAEYPRLSTADVNTRFVQVVTAAHKCRLAELPSVVEPRDVGVPRYFISHAWKNSFDLLLRGIEGFLSSAAEDTRVWVDIIAVNQHPDSGVQAADVGAFKDVVRAASGGTLVVMDLSSCNPATRAWCIYEWAATVGWHGPDGLHMQVNTADRATLVSSTDVEQAECFNPSDKVAILADVVAQHSSTSAFNSKLKLQLLLEPLSYRVDVKRLLQRAAGTPWDFGAVEAWMDEKQGGSRVLCITAGAGEGKSTLSAALCEGLGAGGGPEQQGSAGGAARARIAAYHFIKYSDQRRLEPVRAVKSLAFQLALKLPGVCSRVLALNAAEVSGLPSDDAVKAAEVLLRDTLVAATRDEAWGDDQQVVILLDALDEADPPPTPSATAGPATSSSASAPGQPSGSPAPAPGQSAAAATGAGAGAAVASPAEAAETAPPVCANKLFMLLAKDLKDLPRCVRFIVTTRPDGLGGSMRAALEAAFRDSGGVVCLPASQLRKRAAAPPSRPTAAVVEMESAAKAGAAAETASASAVAGGGGGGGAADASSASAGGVLVYHTVAAECFGAGAGGGGQQGGAAPSDRRRPAPPTPALPALSGLPRLEDLYGLYRRLFEGALAGTEPAKRHELSKLMAVLLAAQEPLPEALLHSMGLAGILPALPGYPVTWFVDEHHLYSLHKSLSDWLTDPRVAGPFAVDLQLGHACLSQHFLAVVRAGATPTPYMLKYLVRHLVAVRRVAELEALLFDFDFLAAAFSQGHGHALLGDLLGLSGPSPLLQDCQRWLLAKQHELVKVKTGDEVLATMLRCPSDTAVFRRAQELTLVAAAAAATPCWRIRHALGVPKTWPGLILSATGHKEVVQAVSWHPTDGVTFASGCEAGEVRIWNSTTGQCVATLQSNEPGINGVAWRPDGRKLAAGGDSKAVKLFDGASGQCDAVLTGHEGSVRSVCWAPSGLLLASASLDKTVRVWDAAAARCVAILEPKDCGQALCVRWSPDGCTIATGWNRKTLCLWDASLIPAAPPSPSSPPTAGDGGDEPPKLTQCTVLKGHTGRLTGVAWSPDGSKIASSSTDCNIRIWDRNGDCLATLEGHARDVICVAFRRDGRVLVSGGFDSTVRFWDTDTWREINKLEGEMAVCLDMSPDGKRLASCTGGRDVGVMDAEGVVRAERVEGHTGNVNSVVWRRGGTQLLTASRDGTVRVWDGDSGAACAVLRDDADEVLCAAYNPACALIASCGHDTDIRLWSAESNKLLATLDLNGHSQLVNWVTWHPGGTLLASVSKDKTVRLWDLQPPAGKGVVESLQETSFRKGVRLEGHDAEVSAAEFSPGGETLATGGHDKEIRLWAVPEDRTKLEGMETILTLKGHNAWVACLAWHQDGRRLASSCGGGDKIRVWEISPDRRSGTCLHILEEPHGFVYAVRWSPCGSLLASSSYRTVRIWDADGRLVQVLEGHSQMVMNVAWREDGRAIATAGFDNVVMVYERA